MWPRENDWKGKRKYEGDEGMAFPHKQLATKLLAAQQQQYQQQQQQQQQPGWSQGGANFRNRNLYPYSHQNQNPGENFLNPNMNAAYSHHNQKPAVKFPNQTPRGLLSLNPNPHSQQNQIPIHEQSPLGLRLKKTTSFLEQIQRRLSEEKALEAEELRSQTKKTNIFKASCFAASHLRIGSWEYKTMNVGCGLLVKFYFAKHKLVWEILHSGVKYKMEILWSDITSIKANTPDNEPGTLSLVLGKPPDFFKESDPQPKKRTLWHKSKDFTGGQASTYRQHILEFAPGALYNHFKRLVQCDNRLGLLSQLPQTTLEIPYFLTIAANQRQLKDGVVNQPDAYDLHDIAPVVPVPQDSLSNSKPLVSHGVSEDSSYYTESPLSDTLASFDNGCPRAEPFAESPIASVNDVLFPSPSPSTVPNAEEQLPFGSSLQGFSDCEYSLKGLFRDDPQATFGSSLQEPNLQPPLSVNDYEDQSDFAKLHQILFSDTTTEPDKNFMIPRVESFINIHQSDQDSQNAEYNSFERLVNSDGVQDGKVLGPVNAYGPTPDVGAQEKCLNDSDGALDEDFFNFDLYDKNNDLPGLTSSGVVQDGNVRGPVNAHGSTSDVVAQDKCLNDSGGFPDDKNFLMPRVDSLSCFLQNDKNNNLDGLVNSEGVEDGEDLELLNAFGTPDVDIESLFVD